MMKFEFEIHYKTVVNISIEENKKMQSVKQEDIFKLPHEILNKLDNVKKWLRIHPISGQAFYMGNREYDEYKEFIEQKKYIKKPWGNIELSVLDKLRGTLSNLRKEG